MENRADRSNLTNRLHEDILIYIPKKIQEEEKSALQCAEDVYSDVHSDYNYSK